MYQTVAVDYYKVLCMTVFLFFHSPEDRLCFHTADWRVSKQANIISYDTLPDVCQAYIWTSAEILLIRP